MRQFLRLSNGALQVCDLRVSWNDQILPREGQAEVCPKAKEARSALCKLIRLISWSSMLLAWKGACKTLQG